MQPADAPCRSRSCLNAQPPCSPRISWERSHGSLDRILRRSAPIESRVSQHGRGNDKRAESTGEGYEWKPIQYAYRSRKQ
eukprot:1215124-Amorphochlora_amoeboformis.AAC.1